MSTRTVVRPGVVFLALLLLIIFIVMVVLATIEAMKLSADQISEEPDAPYPYPTDVPRSSLKLPSGIDEMVCRMQNGLNC